MLRNETHADGELREKNQKKRECGETHMYELGST